MYIGVEFLIRIKNSIELQLYMRGYDMIGYMNNTEIPKKVNNTPKRKNTCTKKKVSLYKLGLCKIKHKLLVTVVKETYLFYRLVCLGRIRHIKVHDSQQTIITSTHITWQGRHRTETAATVHRVRPH